MSRGELHVFVDVADTPERAWQALTDWHRQQEWMIATKVRVIGARREGVGVRLRAVTGVAGVGVVDLMEVTHWEPPRLCRVRHTGRVLRGWAAFSVQPIAGGTRVDWTESLELPAGRLGALGWPVARPMVALGLRMAMHRFSRWLHDYV